jgi:hypothetical protein
MPRVQSAETWSSRISVRQNCWLRVHSGRGRITDDALWPATRRARRAEE